VYQAGTLSGNPLAMAAGLKTLEILRRPGSYERLDTLGARLADGLGAAARATGVDVCINRVGSMLTLFFCPGPVTDYRTAKSADTGRFAGWYRELRERGVLWPPSQFEAAFVSLAHGEDEIDVTVHSARESFALASGAAP
jgi:glutamate-1-semialdehyde 2,1-aminomutase